MTVMTATLASALDQVKSEKVDPLPRYLLTIGGDFDNIAHQLFVEWF
jgi:hypothetical protein